MRLSLLCLLLPFVALPSAAQIYRLTDAHGNTVYTDQPPHGSAPQPLQLPPTNRLDSAPPAAGTPPPAEHSDQQLRQPYTLLELTGLPDDEALRANNGTFTVGARLEPALQPAHSLRFLLDDRPVGKPGPQVAIQIEQLARGQHRLQVEVLSGHQVIQRSTAKTFTLQRVHTSSPAFRPGGAP